MVNPMNLTDRKIMVTGASSGIGRQTAIFLSELGAQLVLLGRDEERLLETFQSLQPGQHKMISFDLNDFEAYDQVFKEATEDGGKLNGLVHCAGVVKAIPLKVVSVANIMETMNVNYISFMELVRFYSKKKYSQGGSISAISAINAHYPQKCMSVYAASKGALEAAIRTLALELHPSGIRINSVIAGPITTPLSEKYSAQMGEETNIVGTQLMGAGLPQDIANTVAFLMSDMSTYVTGRNFYADGGRL